MGYEYLSKDGANVVVSVLGEEKNFQLLAVCDFTSTRKRSSCIYLNEETDEIVLYTKGADSIITNLLSQDSLNSETKAVTQEKVDEFSEIGLRTLFVAQRVLGVSEFEEWKET